MVNYLAKKIKTKDPNAGSQQANELMPLLRSTTKELLVTTASVLAVTCAHAGQHTIAAKPPSATANAKAVTTIIPSSTDSAKPVKTIYHAKMRSSEASHGNKFPNKIFLPELLYSNMYKYLDPKSNALDAIKFSMSKTAYSPYYYMRPGAKGQEINLGKDIGFVPIPMDTRNATVAYITYVIKHKGFSLYSENSPSGEMAITLGKGNHGEVEFSISLTF